MPTKLPRSRRLRLIGGVIVVVIVGLGLFGWYVLTHPLSNRSYGFQYYSPTQLPKGFYISDKQISVSSKGWHTKGISAGLKFNNVRNWIYVISERKVAPDASNTSAVMQLQNYDPLKPGYTCKHQLSPSKQQYQLCHSVDFGTINSFQVDLVKGKTHISAHFPADLSRTITEKEFNTFVDSFQKADAKGFKIRYTNYGA